MSVVESKSVESLLDDGGPASEWILMYVEGLVEYTEIHHETWFEMLSETEGLAIRVGGSGRYAWFLHSIEGEGVTVTRPDQETSTEHDIMGEYIQSMIDHYEVTIVRASNVRCLDVNE